MPLLANIGRCPNFLDYNSNVILGLSLSLHNQSQNEFEATVYPNMEVLWPSPLNRLTATPTKWSNTLKQFAGKWPNNCLSVLSILWGWRLKG